MKLKFKVEKRRMKEKSVRLVVFGIVLVLLASGIGTVSAFSNSGDGDWKYYKEITVKENSGKTLTDFQVLVDLNPSNFPANAKSDGSDLRFKEGSGKELSYWIEEWNYPNNAKIWVKVPSIPANGETKIRMYYGNPSASAVSDGDTTFEFFDDFEDGDISDWEPTSCGCNCYRDHKIDMKKRLNLPVNTYVVELYGRETACWGYCLCLYIDGTKYIFEPQNFCYNNADTRQWQWLHSDPLTIPIGVFYLERHDQTSAGFEEMDVIRIRKYTSPEPILALSAELPTTKPTPTITPTPTPPTPPSGKIKAVWLYNPDKYDTSTLMTDFKSAGINTIFLSTDVNNIWKYERFVKSAHENGIEVHAMILEDPRCALKENHASSIKAVETVLDYNDKSLAKFDGINIDTEPYVDLDLEQVWEDYITLLDAIHEKTAGKTVLSADIPRWYDEAKMKDLAPNVDFFAIMAYDSGDVGWNTASEIEDAVASEMGAIRGEGSKAVIGIGVHEGFEDKEAVEKCVDGLYRYYSGDSAFSGVSIFKYESYSGLSGASEAPTEGIPEIPTGEEKGIPGFEAIIAMVGLLAVAYVLRRRK
jgi:PGF-CTERM protein